MTEQKTTLSAWKKAKTHAVTLSSGTVVKIEIPNLPELIKGGQVPNDLLDAAIASQQPDAKVSREAIEQQADFVRYIVAKTVVEPAVTEADVPELPYEDQELLMELATRQRDIDALGNHLGGLHTSKEWRAFRDLPDLD